MPCPNCAAASWRARSTGTQPAPARDGSTHSEWGSGAGETQVGGGSSPVPAYLGARLSAEMHASLAPTLVGSAEHRVAGIVRPALGCTGTEHVATPTATHIVLTRKA